MKRISSILLFVILLVSILPLNSYASNPDETTSITYFEDGSYIVETIQISQARSSGTKTGTKEKTHYGSDGDANWKVVLTGTFTYTGSSVTCTSSGCSVTIYDSSAWYTVSKSASKSGASATASVTMGQKLLGVTVNKVSTSVTLTCDKDGNLS